MDKHIPWQPTKFVLEFPPKAVYPEEINGFRPLKWKLACALFAKAVVANAVKNASS